MSEDHEVTCENCSELFTVISSEKPQVCTFCGSSDISVEDDTE